MTAEGGGGGGGGVNNLPAGNDDDSPLVVMPEASAERRHHNNKGEGDALLTKAISRYLLAAPDDRQHPMPTKEASDEALLASLLLATRIEDSQTRRKLLLSDQPRDGGASLGWFALRLVRQYCRCTAETKEHDHDDDDAHRTATASKATYMYLRVAVRALYLLFCDVPLHPEYTDDDGSSRSSGGGSSPEPSVAFKVTCRRLLFRTLRVRSSRAKSIGSVDVEIVAALTSGELLGVAALEEEEEGEMVNEETMEGGDCWNGPEIVLGRYVSQIQANESAVGGNAEHTHEEDSQEGGSNDGDANNDKDWKMMFQIMDAMLGPEDNNEDEADTAKVQYAQAAAYYLGSCLQHPAASGLVTRQLLLDLIRLATATCSDEAGNNASDASLFLLLALMYTIHCGTDDDRRRGYDVGEALKEISEVDSSTKRTKGTKRNKNDDNGALEVARSILRLLLVGVTAPSAKGSGSAPVLLGIRGERGVPKSGDPSPFPSLTVRSLTFRALAALADGCGLRWMAIGGMLAPTTTYDDVDGRADISSLLDLRAGGKSDLGDASASCALIRLAAGEYRISLGRMVDAADASSTVSATANNDNALESFCNVARDCLTVALCALKLMVEVATAMDEEEDGGDLAACSGCGGYGAFAVLHIRHSILDVLDATVQYLSEDIYHSSGHDVHGQNHDNSRNLGVTMQMQTDIAVWSCRFLFAYLSETNIFEDDEASMGENAPSAERLLSAATSAIGLCDAAAASRKDNEDEDPLVPLLPGLASILSSCVDVQSQTAASRIRMVRQSILKDGLLTNAICRLMDRLRHRFETTDYDTQACSCLASLNWCVLVILDACKVHRALSSSSPELHTGKVGQQRRELCRATLQWMRLLLVCISGKKIVGASEDLFNDSLQNTAECWLQLRTGWSNEENKEEEADKALLTEGDATVVKAQRAVIN